MTKTQQNLLIGVIGAALLAAAMYMFYSSPSVLPQFLGKLGIQVGNNVSVEGTGSSTVEVIGDVPPPSTDRPITVTATLSEEAKTILKSNMEALITDLKKDPTRVDLWLKLATNRKIAGDYAGAEEEFKYVAVMAPLSINYIAYGNLGDLYMNFLKDYPKAEYNYKTAISIKPDTIGYYRDLYTLYRYLYKTDTAAAADIVAEGLRSNPGNADLLKLQQELNASAQ